MDAGVSSSRQQRCSPASCTWPGAGASRCAGTRSGSDSRSSHPRRGPWPRRRSSSSSARRLTVRPSLPPVSMHSVSILIPTFNESPDVLRPTVLGALAVRHEPAPEILVLDDGCRPWVSEMCEELGCRYVVRPAPRLHAKAGNLNHVLPLLTTELVFVLDADHVPLPHCARAHAGLLQRPRRRFRTVAPGVLQPRLPAPAPCRQPGQERAEPLLRGHLPGKDRNNSVFWCGSSAVLRRSALASVGGVATETVVEDTHTGMLMHAAGWTSVSTTRCSPSASPPRT